MAIKKLSTDDDYTEALEETRNNLIKAIQEMTPETRFMCLIDEDECDTAICAMNTSPHDAVYSIAMMLQQVEAKMDLPASTLLLAVGAALAVMQKGEDASKYDALFEGLDINKATAN